MTVRSMGNIRWVLLGLILLAVMGTAVVSIFPQFVGEDAPESFSLCEDALDETGGLRVECEASDIRFDMGGTAGSQFGFSVAVGFLNGDKLSDLAVGDPSRNRVYIFYGRSSAEGTYGILADSLDRGVSPESQADVILFRDPAIPSQVVFFGYSLAISRPQPAEDCGEGLGAALLIGAPGNPSGGPNAPGSVFYLPPASLCFAPENPPNRQTLDPVTLGQRFSSPNAQPDDLFGYSVAFGKVLLETGDHDDVIVGATGALSGAGRVTVFAVNGGTVSTGLSSTARLIGLGGDGLGEVLATGDLDGDFDEDLDPNGNLDDLAIGAVGSENGKLVLVQGPLSVSGGSGGNGVFQEGKDTQLRLIGGEQPFDFFGFSVDISAEGRLAVGAVLANNDPPDDGDGGNGGDERSNVASGTRINAGKVYVWEPGFLMPGPEIEAAAADLIMVARRSGDQLGFAVGFGDMDEVGGDDLVVTARREDGTGLTVNEIDQGTAYVILTTDSLTSPVDLNLCAVNEDCSGVNGIEVMIFGGDRAQDRGDEMGFALAISDFNGDQSKDLFVSSLVQRRVYVITLEDNDSDRDVEGRNIRDEDDDEDGDPDSTDCAPQNDAIFSEAMEITCNGIDENCNGMDDDVPDADGDGFDACGQEQEIDCDDNDPLSYPGADELCDGNDNACSGLVPTEERDLDNDGYAACSGWSDSQGDQPDILGGDDCDPFNANTYPGAAPEDSGSACLRDNDLDGYGDASPPAGVDPGSDCDDTRDDTFPGAAPNDDPIGCLRDADDDDWGDASAPSPVPDGTDCDDLDVNSFPGAVERCDGNDNACSGSIPTDEIDTDSDGHVECEGWEDTQGDNVVIQGGGDCDTSDAATFPGSAPNESDPEACMTDADGDDYGSLSPAEGVAAGTDCDDDSEFAADTFPGAASKDAPLNCMKDSDGDEYGDGSVALPVVAGQDCNDDNAGQFTGADEIPDDGIDQDCNGFDTVTCFLDADMDGFGIPVSMADPSMPLLSDDGDCDDPGESALDTDCNDTTAAINPGEDEIVGDGIDQDCNGFDTVVCFVDMDADGFGTSAGTTVEADDGSCDAEDGESSDDTDCNDGDPFTYPGAPESCDGNSNSCSGPVPLNETDMDGDGYVACAGWADTQGDDLGVVGGGDCGPDDADIFPGAAPNESSPGLCMKDNDGDDWGDLQPPEGVTPGTDCDDDSVQGDVTFPGAAPGDSPVVCMRDADGDDFGDDSTILPVVSGTDCDDSDGASYPGAPEACDGNDNACSGMVPAVEEDGDGDGYVSCSVWADTQGDDGAVAAGGDCDDTSQDTFPGAAEKEAIPDTCRKDTDGDGFGDLQPPSGVAPGTDCDDDAADTFIGAAPKEMAGTLVCMKDSDGDDWGDVASSLPVVAGTDCDDASTTANPGGLEGPPGDATCSDVVDNDCDSDVDGDDQGCVVQLPCPDGDDDGYADCTTDPLCDATGLTCGDCQDSDDGVNPEGTEVCDNKDNDCNGTVDDGFDGDGDGFTTCALPVADCNDGDPQVNPGEQEKCNDMVDNDCDVSTPDLFDSDGDGADCDADCDDGNPALNLVDGDGDTFTTCSGDCNDGDGNVSPGQLEVCNDSIDNDCNSATPDVGDADMDGASCELDCDDTDPGLNLDDADMDGFTSCAGDCDDDDAGINPSATDLCDGIDNDCNGTVDDAFDMDGDLFSTCQLPIADCDDSNPSINPGESEVCNDGVDNDCNPTTEDLGDADDDGFACNVDCDDGDGSTYPGASEQCDGNINTCGGLLPDDEVDTDGDGYVVCSGWNDSQGDQPEIQGGGDCDPADADAHPDSSPNEGLPGACMRDQDADDWGDLQPPPGVTPGTDCDDQEPNTFKGAAPNEISGSIVCMRDQDGDDWGDSSAVLPVVAGSDCADMDMDRNPGATEICGDMIDSDCDGEDPVCPPVASIRVWMDSPTTLSWSAGAVPVTGERFDVYQGDLLTLRATGNYTQETGSVPQAARYCDVGGTSLSLDLEPAPGERVFFLVALRNDPVDGALGESSAGQPRTLQNPCP